MNILLLEDDRELGRLIESELKKREFQVFWSQDLQSANQMVLDQEFALAIVDLNLPDGKGFDVINKLECPVIIMSALSDPENRLKGVKLGAIDFIPKPFLLQELFLKIERALGESLQSRKVWKKEDVVLDLNLRQITQGETTHLLNKRDFRLLDILTKRFPEVVSRDEIINYVYGTNQNPSQRTIDNAVVGIRQMLADSDHSWIRSVRGEGYQWMLKGDSP